MKSFFQLLGCKLFGNHEWTAASLRGEKMTVWEGMTFQEAEKSFRENCRMYCKNCGYNSQLNNW